MEEKMTIYQKKVEIDFLRWWKDREKATHWDAYLEGYLRGLEKAMEVVREK